MFIDYRALVLEKYADATCCVINDSNETGFFIISKTIGVIGHGQTPEEAWEDCYIFMCLQ